MDVEHCIRGDGQELRNFFHQIKKTVGNCWPDDMSGSSRTDEKEEREAQAQRGRQRGMDYSFEKLGRWHLQRKA